MRILLIPFLVVLLTSPTTASASEATLNCIGSRWSIGAVPPDVQERACAEARLECLGAVPPDVRELNLRASLEPLSEAEIQRRVDWASEITDACGAVISTSSSNEVLAEAYAHRCNAYLITGLKAFLIRGFSFLTEESDCYKAVKLAPGYGYAYFVRGNLRIDERDLKGAIADFDRAAELGLSDEQDRADLQIMIDLYAGERAP